MTEPALDKPVDLTEVEKSAVVMMSIGQEAAAEVVKFLSQPEINLLSMAMARISSVSKNSAVSVLQEFVAVLQQESSIGIAAEDYVRGVLEKALGTEQADRLASGLKQGRYSAGIEAVKWQDPRILAEMVKSENPQIVAMIAAHLEPEQAKTLMEHLPDELVEQVIPRLAVLDAIPQTAIQELSESLEHLLAGGPPRARISIGGIDVAAKILNSIGAERAGRVLETISNVDRELAQSLSDNMLVFEDLFTIDDRSFQIFLRAVDQKLLVSALKGTTAELRDKVLRNFSQRASEMLREEIEARGPMRLAEVDAAKKELVAAAKALEREGKVILRTSPGDLVS